MWKLSIVILSVVFVLPESATARLVYGNYGSVICKSKVFKCKTVQPGKTWFRMFPDANKRNIVRRINRLNTRLYPGMRIAVPRDWDYKHVMDYSPFPLRITPPGHKLIVMDHPAHAFGAYDKNGHLVKWGPAAGGAPWCPDIKEECKTIKGNFKIYAMRGADCKSRTFPIPNGGSPMPYCMFFHKGYAMHGSYEVPGTHASHGCIRLFPADARWLHNNFVGVGATRVRVQ